MGHNLPSSFLECAFILKVNLLSKIAVRALHTIFKVEAIRTKKGRRANEVSFTLEIAFKLISKRTYTTFYLHICIIDNLVIALGS